MITLKEALALKANEISSLQEDLVNTIKQDKHIGCYVAQFTNNNLKLSQDGSIPIAVKANINVIGWETTACSNILKGYTSVYNATVIENMHKAGLGAFGHTNMDEFAMGSSTESSCYGKTLNPVDNSKVPGGSSGGSAAAVAAGQAIAALGTDTGGSIRQPAAYCGVVGMKPTYGRVSRYGIIAYSSSLDQCGPITQNVEDAAILYDIISGHDEKDSTSANIDYTAIAPSIDGSKKLTIAVIDNYIAEADDCTKKAYANTIEKLKEAGHTIIHKDMMDTKKHVSSYYVIATAEASANLSRYDGIRYGNRVDAKNLKDTYLKTKSQGFGEEVQKRIMLGSFVLSSGYYDAYYIKAQKVRQLIKDEFDAIFEEADLILSPIAPTTAPEFGAFETSLEMYLSDIYTISVNLAGLPAISVPIGKDKDNMPIGLQLIGKAYDEKTLFDGALSLEQSVNYKK